MIIDKPIIIVGAGWAGQTIASVIAERAASHIVGFVDDRPLGETIVVSNGNGDLPIRVLGPSSQLVHLVRSHGAHIVVIAITHNRADHLLSEMIHCYEADILVYEMPELYSRLTRKIPVQHVQHRWIVPHLTAPKTGLYYIFHECLNYLISLLGTALVLLPLFPFIALAVKLDSKGPIFFKQTRVGKKGKTFTLIKFRTMIANAENGKPQWATENDNRITRVGRFLRKFRLDELPQFFNVMRGAMALLGPRPERPEFVEKLSKEIPFYRYRHLVRPGISGWAQVNHSYGNSVQHSLEKLQYDLYWIKNRSFWLDLKIIFKSIKVMLTGFGAM